MLRVLSSRNTLSLTHLDTELLPCLVVNILKMQSNAKTNINWTLKKCKLKKAEIQNSNDHKSPLVASQQHTKSVVPCPNSKNLSWELPPLQLWQELQQEVGLSHQDCNNQRHQDVCYLYHHHQQQQQNNHYNRCVCQHGHHHYSHHQYHDIVNLTFLADPGQARGCHKVST